MEPTLHDLFELVNRWADTHYPGHGQIVLTVMLPSGGAATLPVPAAWRPAPLANGQARPRTDSAQCHRATHSPDFRSVNWYGTPYHFVGMQAEVVRQLWAAWESGAPEVGQGCLLETAESDSKRLRDLFRDHDAWGVWIIPGSTLGSYRLADPPG